MRFSLPDADCRFAFFSLILLAPLPFPSSRHSQGYRYASPAAMRFHTMSQGLSYYYTSIYARFSCPPLRRAIAPYHISPSNVNYFCCRAIPSLYTW